MIPFYLNTISQFLQDKFIISTIISIVSGVVIPIIRSLLEQRRYAKGVMAEKIVKNAQVPSGSGSTTSHIEWKIWNPGNVTLEPSSYSPARKIEFTFGSKAVVSSPPVIKKSKSIPGMPIVTPTGPSATMDPPTLEKDEFILLEFDVQDVDNNADSPKVYIPLPPKNIIHVTKRCKKARRNIIIYASIFIVLWISLYILTVIGQLKLAPISVLHGISVVLFFVICFSGTFLIINLITYARWQSR